MEIKISVIVPVYNVAPYVKQCVESILTQDYDSLEVIIVDDCTPDNSIEIIKSYLEEYPTEKIVKFVKHEENRGISEARNTGLKMATGEYVMFVDSDDLITPNCCKELASRVNESKYDIIVGNRDIIELDTGKIVSKAYTRCPDEREMLNIDDYISYGLQGEVCNKLIRRTFLVDNNITFPKGIVYEDTFWFNVIISYLPKVLYIPFVTYIYQLHGGSTMTTYTLKHFRSQILCSVYGYEFAHRICNEETKWFAYLRAEQYKKAAFLYCLTKTHSARKNYRTLYKYFRQLDLRTKTFFGYKEISLIQKIRYCHNFLPVWLGYNMEFIFLKFKIRQLKRMNVLQCGDSIEVPSDFFPKD